MKEKISYVSANLENQDLSGRNFDGVNFSGANLRNANLKNVSCEPGKVTRTGRRREVEAVGKIVEWLFFLITPYDSWNRLPASVPQVEDETQPAEFSRADLTGADLQKARLREANFSDAILRQANLTSASLVNSILRNADLTNADLSYADLSDAILYKANLEGANLTGIKLDGADFEDANLKKAKLHGVDLRKTKKLDRAMMTGADLHNAILPKDISILTKSVIQNVAGTTKLETNQSVGDVASSKKNDPEEPSTNPNGRLRNLVLAALLFISLAIILGLVLIGIWFAST